MKVIIFKYTLFYLKFNLILYAFIVRFTLNHYNPHTLYGGFYLHTIFRKENSYAGKGVLHPRL